MYEETSKLDNALEDFKKILELDPSHTEANHAVRVNMNTHCLLPMSNS